MRSLAALLIAAASAPAAEPTATVPLLAMPQQHPTTVLAVSPDGSWVALYRSPLTGIGKPPHTIQFWDLKTGSLRISVDVECDSLGFGAVASPDGRKLLARPTRGKAGLVARGTTEPIGVGVVIDVATGRQVTVPNVTNVPYGFTADSAGLYVGEQAESVKEGVIAVRSIPDGKKLREFALPNFGWLSIAPDGRTAHHKTRGNVNEIWDFETGKRVCGLTVDGKETDYQHVFVAFADGGKKVVTHFSDSDLWVYDTKTGKRERVIAVPKGADGYRPSTVGVADDLSCVLARTDANEPVVFEPGKDRFRFTVAAASKFSDPQLTLTRDGTKFLRANPAHGVEVFDAATGRLLHTLRPDTQHVRAMAFSADGKTLVVGTANKSYANPTDPTDPPAGHLLVWDATTGELRKGHAGIDPAVCQTFPTADGSKAVVVAGKVRPDYYGWGTQQASLRDLATGKELRTIAGPKDTFYGFVASADGRHLAAVFTENRKKGKDVYVTPVGTRVWDLPTGDKLRDLGAAPDTRILSFTPDGERILAYSERTAVESWGVESNKSRVIWKPAPRIDDTRWPFPLLALPRGDEFVAFFGFSTNLYGPVCWYAAGRQITFGKVPNQPGPLAVSPDGKWVAAGEAPPAGPARVFAWRLPEPPPFDEKVIKDGVIPPEDHPVEPVVLHGHSGSVNALAFAPDGKTLATGGADCAVRIWDVSTGRLKATLWVAPAAKPGEAPTDWVAFTPDGFFAGTPRGRAFLQIDDADASTFFGFRKPATPVPAAELEQHLLDTARVRASLAGR